MYDASCSRARRVDALVSASSRSSAWRGQLLSAACKWEARRALMHAREGGGRRRTELIDRCLTQARPAHLLRQRPVTLSSDTDASRGNREGNRVL